MSGIIGLNGIQYERCSCGEYFRLKRDEIYEKPTAELPVGRSMCSNCFNIRLNELIHELGHDPFVKPQPMILERFELPASLKFLEDPELA